MSNLKVALVHHLLILSLTFLKVNAQIPQIILWGNLKRLFDAVNIFLNFKRILFMFSYRRCLD